MRRREFRRAQDASGGSLSRGAGGAPARFAPPAGPVRAQLSGPSRGGAALDPCQDHVAEPPSGRAQAETPVSYLSKLLGTTTMKEAATSSSSPRVAEIRLCHPLSQPFSSTNLVAGTSASSSGAISQDLSTHILISVDHSRACRKLERLLSAIFRPSGIKRLTTCFPEPNDTLVGGTRKLSWTWL